MIIAAIISSIMFVANIYLLYRVKELAKQISKKGGAEE